MTAISKRDGYLDDATIGAYDPVCHLDLEAVPISGDRADVHDLEHPGPIGPIPRGGIVDGETEGSSCEPVPPTRQPSARGRPVQDPASGHIATSDRCVGPVHHRSDQSDEITRIMGQIRVHLHADRRSRVHRVGEARPIRRTKTSLTGPPKHLDGAVSRGELLGESGGAVGARVVDHEDSTPGKRSTNPVEKFHDVLGLVVGRHDHRHRGVLSHGRAPYRTGRVGALEAYDDSVPGIEDHDSRPLSALPSPGARLAAFVAILAGGLAGALIGYALVNLQCSGSCGLALGLGVLVGAVVAAAGTAVVAVLVLRALGEWREIQDR